MKRLALLLLALGAVAPAPAPAQTGQATGSGPGRPIAGPQFGDGELVWVEAGDDLTTRLVVGDVGRPASVLATAGAPGGANSVTAAFGASSTTALLYALFETPTKGGPQPVGLTVLAGPRGELRPLGDGADVAYNPPAIAGERVAFLVRDSTTGVIRFLDPVSGERSEVPAASYPTSFAVAGDLVAHLLPDKTPAVTNWRTGAELYRAQIPSDWLPPERVALQPDGAALWTSLHRPEEGQPVRTHQGLTTPDAPAARELPLPEGAYVFGLAGNRVLYRDFAPADRWEVAELDGRVLARLEASAAVPTPGFDGRRLGWMSQPCAIPIVTVRDVDAPPPPVPAPLPCGAAELEGRPRVTPEGVRVALRCRGSESTGCVTDVAVTVRRRKRRTLRFERSTIGQATGGLEVLRFGRRASLRGPLRVTIRVSPTYGGATRKPRRFRVRG